MCVCLMVHMHVADDACVMWLIVMLGLYPQATISSKLLDNNRSLLQPHMVWPLQAMSQW